jgi:hypothetical protein
MRRTDGGDEGPWGALSAASSSSSDRASANSSATAWAFTSYTAPKNVRVRFSTAFAISAATARRRTCQSLKSGGRRQGRGVSRPRRSVG